VGLGAPVNHVFKMHEDWKLQVGVFRKIFIFERIDMGGFLKSWCPTTMGFPTRNDHFGVFSGYHHLRKHPYWNTEYCILQDFE